MRREERGRREGGIRGGVGEGKGKRVLKNGEMCLAGKRVPWRELEVEDSCNGKGAILGPDSHRAQE